MRADRGGRRGASFCAPMRSVGTHSPARPQRKKRQSVRRGCGAQSRCGHHRRRSAGGSRSVRWFAYRYHRPAAENWRFSAVGQTGCAAPPGGRSGADPQRRRLSDRVGVSGDQPRSARNHRAHCAAVEGLRVVGDALPVEPLGADHGAGGNDLMPCPDTLIFPGLPGSKTGGCWAHTVGCQVTPIADHAAGVDVSLEPVGCAHGSGDGLTERPALPVSGGSPAMGVQRPCGRSGEAGVAG